MSLLHGSVKRCFIDAVVAVEVCEREGLSEAEESGSVWCCQRFLLRQGVGAIDLRHQDGEQGQCRIPQKKSALLHEAGTMACVSLRAQCFG
jgi:hypothetical protein